MITGELKKSLQLTHLQHTPQPYKRRTRVSSGGAIHLNRTSTILKGREGDVPNNNKRSELRGKKREKTLHKKIPNKTPTTQSALLLYREEQNRTKW